MELFVSGFCLGVIIAGWGKADSFFGNLEKLCPELVVAYAYTQMFRFLPITYGDDQIRQILGVLEVLKSHGLKTGRDYTYEWRMASLRLGLTKCSIEIVL